MRFILCEADGFEDVEVNVDDITSSAGSSDVAGSQEATNFSGASAEREQQTSTQASSELDRKKAENQLNGRQLSSTEKLKLAEKYFDQLFSTAEKRRAVKDVRGYVTSKIASEGTRTGVLAFVRNYIDAGNTRVLPLKAIKVIEEVGADLTDKTLTQPWVWNEDSDDDNIFKMKAVIFIKDPRNLKRYSLYKPGTDNYITLEDIQDKTANEIQLFIDSIQSSDGDVVTFEDVLETRQLSQKSVAEQVKFFAGLYTDFKERERVKQQLEAILSDKQDRRSFLTFEVPHWDQSDDKTLKEPLNAFLKEFAEGQEKEDAAAVAPTLETILKNDFLCKNKTEYELVISALFHKSSAFANNKAVIDTIDGKLKKVFKDTSLYNSLRVLPIKGYSKGKNHALREQIIAFLNKVEGSKGTQIGAVPDNTILSKEEAWNEIQRWKRTVAFTKSSVPHNKQDIGNVRASFEDNWKDRKTIGQLKQDIINSLS